MRQATRVFSLLLIGGALISAQEPAPAPAPSETPATPPAANARAQRPGPRSEEPEPYDKVITKEAKSKKGIFSVHEVKDKYFYEIPKAEYGKDFLWVTQMARTTLGVGYGGQELASYVVYWELRGDKVNLRRVNYDVVADPKTPIAQAVKAANNDAIIMTFPVAAYGPEKESVVIDVTRLFTSDVSEFSARQRLNANAMDASRSYIERISPYPENIETEASLTYTKRNLPPGAQAAAPNPFVRRGHAAGQRHGRSASQHGEAARKADDAARVRRARRLLFGEPDGLQPRRAARARAPLHRTLALGEEGSQRGTFRAGEADRLLHRLRHADEMGPLDEARHRRLAESFRGGRLQERDHREESAHARPKIPTSAPKTSAIP